MKAHCKIVIAGVGGQGVVFLTEILVEAALRAGLPVATSEIHGLSQRGGSVMAGLTIGPDTYGFVEAAGADFLLGLELLEAQRCLGYLHKDSVAIIDDTKIFPHSVNAQTAAYPDTSRFCEYLRQNIQELILIEDQSQELLPVLRNLIVLAKAASHPQFPIGVPFIEAAIQENARGNPVASLEIFRASLDHPQFPK